MSVKAIALAALLYPAVAQAAEISFGRLNAESRFNGDSSETIAAGVDQTVSVLGSGARQDVREFWFAGRQEGQPPITSLGLPTPWLTGNVTHLDDLKGSELFSVEAFGFVSSDGLPSVDDGEFGAATSFATTISVDIEAASLVSFRFQAIAFASDESGLLDPVFFTEDTARLRITHDTGQPAPDVIVNLAGPITGNLRFDELFELGPGRLQIEMEFGIDFDVAGPSGDVFLDTGLGGEVFIRPIPAPTTALLPLSLLASRRRRRLTG